MGEEKKAIILKVSQELEKQISNPGAMRALLAVTFKGFKSEDLVKQACLEAMMRGYSFQDLLDKKIYAIPYGSGYSLVQSISDVRAIAMKSGQIGKLAPVFEDDKDGKIITCTVTVQRLISGHVGDYTATVYFSEYNSGKNKWRDMPRTMIAKVAEMHALRMAFPEELQQVYAEEEFKGDTQKKQLPENNLKMGNLLKPNKPTNEEPKKEVKQEEAKGNTESTKKEYEEPEPEPEPEYTGQ